MSRPSPPCSSSVSYTFSRSGSFPNEFNINVADFTLPFTLPSKSMVYCYTWHENAAFTGYFVLRNICGDFLQVSPSCVSFSCYLHDGKHSLQSSWIRQLLKVLLSCCQVVKDELGLGCQLLDSITGLLLYRLFPPHLSLSHCILLHLTSTQWFQICWFFCAI